MLNIIKGSIFDTDADVIAHQVNCQGNMENGLAKQIKQRYPEVYKKYKTICEEDLKDKYRTGALRTKLLGAVQYDCQNKSKPAVVSLYAQEYFGRDGKCYTNYSALRTCLSRLNDLCRGKKIALPYKIGCGLGGGDWNIVTKIIEDELVDCEVLLYSL